jgi:hypothetical protein
LVPWFYLIALANLTKIKLGAIQVAKGKTEGGIEQGTLK